MKLKTTICCLATLLLSGLFTTSFSQTLKDVFSNSETPMVYLGVDFSKAKLMTSGNPDEIRNRLYSSINYLIITEPKKYDLAGAFHKGIVNNDISVTNAVNEKANINEILSSNSADFNRLKESDILAMVKEFDLKGKSGIGLVFMMEAMRKIDKKADAAIWVTFIDMKTKKVLMTERIENKVSGGIGFRNYWASSIKNLIETIEKKKYKEWQAKFSN
ncbi:MAG: hypothetical protein ABIW38_03670 [Ferruginibacter sp.]